jgi:hydrogenase expression/formation protein HypC
MCVTYPAQVVEIADGAAIVDFGPRRQRASLILVPDAVVGDWVIVAAGTALEVLDAAEAMEIVAMLDAARQEEGPTP